MGVINARIPAPAAGSATAQVEMTLADTSTAGAGTLLAATSPIALDLGGSRPGRAP
jgi:hypothetical protein